MRLRRELLVSFCGIALLLSCASGGTGGKNADIQEPSPVETPLPPDNDFIVTKDVYAQTFAEVEALISTLNSIIREKSYDEWLEFLSAEYIAKTGSSEFLREASQSSILLENRIVLKSLKDYFLSVVVPSRSQAVLSDISFIDATHVNAITVIDGKPVILYMLVKEDTRWMVGIW
jgi:hypothetical protein